MASRSLDRATVNSSDLGRATRVRYGVLGFAAALSMITYLDRVCVASAASALVVDLGLNSVADLRLVFSAFALAYALFEVPTGWLGDVYGPRRVLIRIVLWWSFFTVLTGIIGMHVGGYVLGVINTTILGYATSSIFVLVVVRFLFGVGEAGAYPNITRALHNWFPFHERGFAQGTVWMSARLMGGLTPLVWLLLVEGAVIAAPAWLAESGTTWSIAPLLPDWSPVAPRWRVTFWFFGLLGIVWCVLFMAWFRDRPEQKRSVNAAEMALIRPSAAESEKGHAGIPWLRIVTSGNLWLLCVMYACQSYGWYFYITYLPRFLEEQHNVLPTSLVGAIYKGGPLWMGAIGCFAGGLLTDWFIRRTGNRRLGRRIFGIIGHAACVFCFLACSFAETAFTFFLSISLAGFFADLTMGSSWALCQDIGRRHAAIVAGFMNMIGNLGGALATWVSGYVLAVALERYAAKAGTAVEQLTSADKVAGLMGGYQVNFLIFAAVYVVGVICWTLVDSTKAVVPGD